MILVFFSLCLGALLGALFRFPWYVFFPATVLLWRKNKGVSIAVFFILSGAFLYSLGTLSPGNYELVGLAEGSRVTHVKVFQGEWKKVHSIRMRTSKDGYIYAIGHYDGSIFYPSYLRDLEKPSPRRLREQFSKEVKGTAFSLLFGEKDNAVYRSGLGHFFAVSGLHVGIAFSLYTTLISLFTWRRTYQEFVALLLLIPYVLSVNTPSVLRAYLTILLWKILRTLGFKTTPSYITATVGSLMIVFDPTVLFTSSFLLSFFVTLSILNSKNIFELVVKAYLSSLPFLCLFFGETNISALLFSIPMSFAVIPVTWVSHLSFLLFLLGLKASSMVAADVANIISFPVDVLIKLSNMMPVIPLPKFLFFILIPVPLILLFDIRGIIRRTSDRAIL
ncbi:ComEC/Rec2 family competence protein [Thermotoga sp. SG1]|uniref:ComEC/Rec2 family competence protein n=1 Tax=Thermotoga sp. SG1 TaxID=126739 RepID=UPI000C75E5EC|nr:ComEC/Rec2 family competence protein [Thermotoga sp. SG1]PLV55610.1 competence protein [Thermotoga sp. SG1]